MRRLAVSIPVVRAEILDMLREFVMDERHTVFLSSHITSDIEKIADYILLIHKGEILLYEDRDTLLEKYALIRVQRRRGREAESGHCGGCPPGPVRYRGAGAKPGRAGGK